MLIFLLMYIMLKLLLYYTTHSIDEHLYCIVLLYAHKNQAPFACNGRYGTIVQLVVAVSG
jgi:hypothetical protein